MKLTYVIWLLHFFISHTLKLNVDFNTSIPLPLTLVAFLEFDSTITVNKQSQIGKSYTTG